MAETYTYTARSVDNPEKVITFTLYDGHVRVNLTGLLEDLGTITAAEDKSAEIKRQLKSQAGPTTLKFLENMTGPFHVKDTTAILDEEDHLKVTAWKRMAGLRLAPVMISVGKVDNPDAAEAFVEEIDQRAEETESINRFFGPLDYWLGWLLMITGLVVLFRWPRKEK